jgi:phosphomannomutase
VTDDAALVAAARAWRDQDPDDETRDELDAVLAAVESGDAAATADLRDRFGTRLAFGTAGLRAEPAPASPRSSRVVSRPPRS